VYERLSEVRAYNEWVTGPEVPLERLHQLRIAIKRLRYTLEYFVEVLGPEAEWVIEECKALQDHLGDLQDAGVASNLLRDFLIWGTWGQSGFKKKPSWPTEPIVAPGVASYLADKQSEIQRLVNAFPDAWARFQSSEFREAVAAAMTMLYALSENNSIVQCADFHCSRLCSRTALWTES
jgi:CHAD domain-containing protein